ncbi:MAG: WG repeat-containing protein [Flavobacteriales bacterium]|nr:WG repeat-containing protein [Flavobacteriales bacterium]
MKYAKVDTPNVEGFARSSGSGETHAEGIIDAQGVEIIPPLTSILIDDITGSTALVRNGREHLFVDLSNGTIDTNLFATEKGYQYAEPFRCNRAIVEVDDRWFYIDTIGNALFGETYDFAETFHHDRAMVKEGERYRIIDTAGNTVARMPYDQVNPYTATRWQVTNIRGDDYMSGFVDLDGKEVVPLIYTEIGMWQPEVKRSRAVIKEKVGYLDEFGNVAIPIQYAYAEIFDKGKARVMLNGREFFIDPEGKEVVE